MIRASTPQDILPAGDDFAIVVNPFSGIEGKARKGTVAATLNNIAILDRLLLSDDLEPIRLLYEEISKLIESLKVVGIFDLFTLDEWVQDEQRLGRIYVVALYLKHNPAEITERIAAQLKNIKQTTRSIPLRLVLEDIPM